MKLRRYAVAFQTLLLKEYLRFIRIWMQTVLPPMMTTALYFIIFGNLIGAQIGDVQGYSYVEYIVPGLIMLAIITNSYANVVSSFFNAKFQRHIEEMLVSPVPNTIILMGFVAGGLARGMTVGIAVTLVSMIFSDLHLHDGLIVIVVALLTSAVFSLAGFVNGIFARSFDDVAIVPTFVLTPLTYLGGIFYSVDMLPEFWRQVSLANPMLYMINGFRYGLLGVADIDIGRSLIIIMVFLIGLAVLALYLLKRGIGVRS
jgi:ABC-2 type transport system permease protein